MAHTLSTSHYPWLTSTPPRPQQDTQQTASPCTTASPAASPNVLSSHDHPPSQQQPAPQWVPSRRLFGHEADSQQLALGPPTSQLPPWGAESQQQHTAGFSDTEGKAGTAGQQAASTAPAQAAKKKKPFVCSLCQQPGHNRGKCPYSKALSGMIARDQGAGQEGQPALHTAAGQATQPAKETQLPLAVVPMATGQATSTEQTSTGRQQHGQAVGSWAAYTQGGWGMADTWTSNEGLGRFLATALLAPPEAEEYLDLSLLEPTDTVPTVPDVTVPSPQPTNTTDSEVPRKKPAPHQGLHTACAGHMAHTANAPKSKRSHKKARPPPIANTTKPTKRSHKKKEPARATDSSATTTARSHKKKTQPAKKTPTSRPPKAAGSKQGSTCAGQGAKRRGRPPKATGQTRGPSPIDPMLLALANRSPYKLRRMQRGCIS